MQNQGPRLAMIVNEEVVIARRNTLQVVLENAELRKVIADSKSWERLLWWRWRMQSGNLKGDDPYAQDNERNN